MGLDADQRHSTLSSHPSPGSGTGLINSLDEVQQANAITAAVREVVLLINSQHLTAGIDFAVKSKDQPGAISDMIGVLRAAMRQ